ncbi:MAG: FAD-binding oxidoreductase [Pseudobdellovibrionaceae bacterium]
MSSLRIPFQTKIEKIIDHTDQVRELVLASESLPEFKFRCGQFVMLHVPQPNEPKPALRAYSIASEEQNTKKFRLLFKYVPEGKASQFVWSLKGDEKLNFTGPFGKVFFQEPPTEQIVFLNTGTGISQHLSYLLSKKDQYPHLRYRLLFGVRSEKDIYIENELSYLKKQLPNFDFEFVLSRPAPTWKGKVGYVQNFLADFDYKNIPTTFYLCGNGGMIKETKHQLLEVDGLDKTRVWSEAFD